MSAHPAIKNPLLELQALGQSLWLDFLDTKIMASGKLSRMIRDDGLRGVTSNPSIFEQALGEQAELTDLIVRLKKTVDSPHDLYDALAIDHVARATDLLREVYEETNGADGFVSIEVPAQLADDTQATCAEAKRLFALVARPNVMIKVPGTPAGVQSLQRLIADGININITLLFSVSRYESIAEAFLAGLEQRAAAGKDISRIASVASFFLSRIDTLVDSLLEKKDAAKAAKLRGETAIACARLAYEKYSELVRTERWQKLRARGARPQRLLWASTSTKNPKYSDVKYVEALIGPDTVNTLPLETIDAYRDHGRPGLRISSEISRAHDIPVQLSELGIELEDVSAQLEREGLEKFAKAYEHSIVQLRKQFTGG